MSGTVTTLCVVVYWTSGYPVFSLFELTALLFDNEKQPHRPMSIERRSSAPAICVEVGFVYVTAQHKRMLRVYYWDAISFSPLSHCLVSSLRSQIFIYNLFHGKPDTSWNTYISISCILLFNSQTRSLRLFIVCVGSFSYQVKII